MKTFSDYLISDPEFGFVISGLGISRQDCQPPKQLKYYSSTTATAEIIKHNLQWAQSGEGSPKFQFVYLMLPCGCNQRCLGCFMGHDKSRLPQELDGPFFSNSELADICGFAKQHDAVAAVHAGGGELFTWAGAFDYIEFIRRQGLRMMIFTNGTLLDWKKIQRLNELEVALTISMRDTAEKYHNRIVNFDGFRKTVAAIDWAMAEGMHLDNRLEIEMPVTVDNESRVLNDLLPVLRALGIVPMIEEYIQTRTSDQENKRCHSFAQARRYFYRLAEKDAELGINWSPEFGQRMTGEPKCRRPLFSFTVFPSGEVVDCPTNIVSYGNFRRQSLTDIFYSEHYCSAISNYRLCPCSRFFTEQDQDIPAELPEYLREEQI